MTNNIPNNNNIYNNVTNNENNILHNSNDSNNKNNNNDSNTNYNNIMNISPKNNTLITPTNNTSVDEMKTLAAPLKALYYEQLQLSIPRFDVLYHCARGLTECGEYSLASDIWYELIDSGYSIDECRIQLCKCLYGLGKYVQCRKLINQCLQQQPDNIQLIQFATTFYNSVRYNGKCAIYGIATILSFSALLFAYKRSITLNNIHTTNSQISK